MLRESESKSEIAKFGIIVSISVTIFFVGLSFTLSTYEINSEGKLIFKIIKDDGDISNIFTLILGMILSPISAVILSLYIYKKQKRDDENKEKKNKFETKIQTDVNYLQTIIEPLLENTNLLKENFDLFRNNRGPYILEYIEKKNASTCNIKRIMERYNLREKPQQEFIEFVDSLTTKLESYPKTKFSQFSTDTVLIIDCTECDNIFTSLEKLQTTLTQERTRLERMISKYSDNSSN